ncbi:hypothetical protein WA026_015931 [Henosepilachna vigintioctopunctata]|uniref:J domain-containing protein n=1 Tax=Henosepilachna vigintioctopunctata TaxID=420089 RepID=A0AAW1U336_9CUCU
MIQTALSEMGENGRTNSSSAMDKIIGNVTAEMQNLDGQYVPLGYSTPPVPNVSQEAINWNNQNSFENHYSIHCNDSQMFNMNQQFNPPAFNFVQPPPQHIYVPNNMYNKQNNMNNLNYEMYHNLQGNVTDDMFDTNYHLLLKQNNLQRQPHINEQMGPSHLESSPHIQNHTQLIENLVGNWVIPNTTGTYSPFGNIEAYKSNANVFEQISSLDNNMSGQGTDDSQFTFTDQNIEEKFHFTRDSKKPRIVAEVKPMRPTYSDVLTKSCPQTAVKPSKNGIKDTKLKKESGKKNKSEKILKPNTPLNRSSTNNEFNLKEVPTEKNQNLRNGDKNKCIKTNQLDRKWASLDNISEPSIKGNKLKKKDEESSNLNKSTCKKTKNTSNILDGDSNNVKNETYLISKNGLKKGIKTNGRLKNNDSPNASERPPGKRNQRLKKKDNNAVIGFLKQKLKVYVKGWWKIFSVFVLWLYQVISDICSLSLHIGHDMAISSWTWLCLKWSAFLSISVALLKQIRIFTWIWEKFKKTEKPSEPNTSPFSHTGLKNNLPMPTTGEEAMKRLLACKGKDPYSILGVTPTCTDDDIKRYYKRQAVLVHPDKNQQPGAEEAFKILVHAFDMIGEPERRASYDRGVAESAQVEQAWSELTELLAQLQKKVEAAANTIRCSACGLRHKRIKIERPIYAARNCVTCKIHHAAREGDIWAEAQCFGLLWHYYACMEGGVYDITDWASCQKDSLKHIKSDSHHVQYRIALGKQNNQTRRASASPRTDRPDLENLLNSLYGQTDNQNSSRRKNKKTK